MLLLSVGYLYAETELPKQKAPFTPRHEFQLSYGDGSFNWLSSTLMLQDYTSVEPPYLTGEYQWFTEDYYRSAIYSIGTFSASYYYRPLKWFWVGGTLGYFNASGTYYNLLTDQKMGKYERHMINIMPSVRFAYLNRPHLNLYSGLSLGLSIAHQSWPIDASKSGVSACFQVTCFGVSVGEKLFGFAEIGFGMKGLGCFGIGYRF